MNGAAHIRTIINRTMHACLNKKHCPGSLLIPLELRKFQLRLCLSNVMSIALATAVVVLAVLGYSARYIERKVQ